MKTDGFTKIMLVVIALAMFVLIGQGWNSHITTVQAASGQMWEYKILNWSYEGNGHTLDHVVFFKEDGKIISPSEDGQAPNVGGKVQELGSKGWELIADTTYSRHAQFKDGTAANGLTSDEQLVFKRQKH